MQKRIKAIIGLVVIVGVTLPMADGCHKHSKVKNTEASVAQLASAQIVK